MNDWLSIPAGAAAARAVADALLPAVRTALLAHGSALLGLAGGRTPADAYTAMAARELDWSRVTIVPTDERFVAGDHADSNEFMLRRCFARSDGREPVLLGLRGTAGTLDAAAADAAARLDALARPFDLTVLGVGADGHIASLFPGAAELAAAMAPAGAASVFVMHPTAAAPPPAVPRLTLGLKRLLWSRRVVLLFGGNAKRQVVEAAMRAPDPARLPVSAVFGTGAPPLQVIYLEEP
jgi:6-phosphogluconolactonase